MSSERQRLRPWLEERIESGDVPGLHWIDKEKTKFRVTWKHAGKPDFNLDQDAVLFRMWAEHTGKYKPGEQPDPSTWKTRFRCALHKMPDIEEIRVPHSLDENEPYRVFRLKPKVLSSTKQRKTSITQSFSTPCSSPPSNDYNTFSYPPGGSTFPSYHGFLCTQKNNAPMCYNPDMFPFPSPISSHTSSPTNSADFNTNIFEPDIDRITPTFPPIPQMPFVFDQSFMDRIELKPQQPIPYTALNDDFIFKNNFTNTLTSCLGNHYEPTLTELQSVSRSEQIGYSGGGSGAVLPTEGLLYNNMSYNVGNTCQSLLLSGQNGNNTMEIADTTTTTIEQVHSTTAHRTTIEGFEKLVITANQAEDKTELCLLSCRVYYNNKEVSRCELNSKERVWRICYENLAKPADNTSLNQFYSQYNAKLILLPDISTCDDVQFVLNNFNEGLVLDMMDDGVMWAAKICQSKVLLSRGSQDVAMLSRDVRTKVFDFSDLKLHKDSQDNAVEPAYEFMLSIGEDPSTALIKLVFTCVQNRN
ncbi:hypothetical protein QZH41_019885 [Actinostola sp. cb2023]|nr:hypothetical protein QZH41_019885 [Actinostola sp. cb2023]